MRGFLAGIVLGAVVSGLALMAAEPYLPTVVLQPPAPEAGEVAVPAGSEFNAERPDAPPILPGTEAPPEGADAPAVARPGAPADSLPDTTPLDTPQTAPLAETGLTPPPEAPTPMIVTGGEAGALPQPQPSAPDVPQVDAAIDPGDTAALPQAEAAPEAPDEPAPVAEEAGQDAPQIVAEGAAEAPAMPGVAQPAAPETDSVASAGESAAPPLTSTAPDTPSAEAPAAEPAVEPAEIAALPPAGDAPPAPGADTADTPPETGAAPATPAESPAAAPAESTAEAPAEIPAVEDAPPTVVADAPEGLRLPVPALEDMAPGVTTDRLPRIGAETEEPDEAPLARAIERNAVPFEADADAPLIALVLVDVGPVRPDPSIFADFPLPLTVAVDPTVPHATELMRAYRQAGLEVAILTPLPEGAAPADIEVAFQGFLAALPQAVAVMDVPEAALQESRPRAAQVVDILAETGHGLVTYDKGLNPALQIAGQAEVPAALVFRDIDPGHHDVDAMKRFLDQAAFRAGLDGVVILKAEARPETLAALAEWTLGTRAATVSFAPLSAVLNR